MSFDNMGKPEGHYAKWNKSDRKTTTVWSHLYRESKRKKIPNS